jgi:hypothetical protein
MEVLIKRAFLRLEIEVVLGEIGGELHVLIHVSPQGHGGTRGYRRDRLQGDQRQ